MKTNKIRGVPELLPQAWRRVWWWIAVRRDSQTGKLFYTRQSHRVFVNHRRDYPYRKPTLWAYDHVIFKRYRPKTGDTVVDVGAGYGEEAVFLGAEVRYIGVEVQPSTYECLALTARQFPLMTAVPFAISDTPVYLSTSKYNEAASQVDDGDIEVPNLPWTAFLKRYKVDRIDLLKINIEGGELALLRHLDLSCVRHVVVCCHDFRANRGDGEHFRTFEQVQQVLSARGLSMEPICTDGPDWARWWFYVNCASARPSPAD